MEGMELKGTVYRIRECAFDLLSMEDDLIDDDEDSWELMGRDLSLKSTFLYCDLNRVIACSHDDQKKALTDLANRLFYYMEEALLSINQIKKGVKENHQLCVLCSNLLGHAVKSRSISLTQVHYNDAALVLQEVMAALIHPPLD